MKKLKKMVMGILGIIIVVVLITVAVINQPQFGRNPRGARLERIMKSPHGKTINNNVSAPIHTRIN